MWFWQQGYRALVLDEAHALMEAHGDQAYYVARQAMRLARERKDSKAEKHFSRVAMKIADLTDREIGLDTSTRYLEHPAQSGKP